MVRARVSCSRTAFGDRAAVSGSASIGSYRSGSGRPLTSHRPCSPHRKGCCCAHASPGVGALPAGSPDVHRSAPERKLAAPPDTDTIAIFGRSRRRARPGLPLLLLHSCEPPSGEFPDGVGAEAVSLSAGKGRHVLASRRTAGFTRGGSA
ncbi:hypothetical protein MTP99_011742 [Tenebrio molitor]|jgi:hypothetical protein|nr:hypothetical protein MTP99_011742 [Tenebrio molitor]